MKRIVMVIGGVETLEYFTYQMGKTFVEMGFQVFYYDLKNETYSARTLRKFIRVGETALVTFNFEGLEKEPGVYKPGIGYIWDEYRIPCYNIVVDHPYYYHDRLTDLPKRYHHISIDRYQEQYFKEFYPEFHHEGFLPLAGTALPDRKEAMNAGENMSENLKGDAERRSMDIVMTGNYVPPSFCEPHINWINEEYAAFYRGIIDDLVKYPNQTVESAELRHCEREMGKTPYDDIRIAMHRMIFIDLYVRNYWRGEAVKTLVNAGFVVDVFGKGWDELECEKPENLRIHAQITSEECLQQLKKAKISLNVMPWFKDGAHDRVFNSILNGAVCVSDKSKYLCEELAEGEGVCYFDLTDLSGLPQKMQDLLQNDLKMQEILEKGVAKVQKYHTWDARAKEIAKWLVF